MYSKPVVERFGTFRELTQTGIGGAGDGCIVLDPVTGDDHLIAAHPT